MALDSTVGGENANSFLSRDDADAIAAEHPFASAYNALAGAARDIYLIRATRIIHARQCWTGTATSSTQALSWPRSGMLSRNGYAIANNVIPYDLKLATFELALLLIENASATNPTDPTREPDALASGLSSLTAGRVSMSFRSDFEMRDLPEAVTLLLVPSWLCPATGSYATLRVL